MASCKDVKKDINFLADQMLIECFSFMEYSPVNNQENVLDILHTKPKSESRSPPALIMLKTSACLPCSGRERTSSLCHCGKPQCLFYLLTY